MATRLSEAVAPFVKACNDVADFFLRLQASYGPFEYTSFSACWTDLSGLLRTQKKTNEGKMSFTTINIYEESALGSFINAVRL